MKILESSRQLILNRRESDIAFILLDRCGKLNTLGADLMNELGAVLAMLKQDKSIKGLVIISGKAEHFILGADLFEIRKAGSAAELHKLSSDGQKIMNLIAGLPYPVVAAINGACLGGGLELALAAHWRIGTDNPLTILGLPEVKLGIIPGLGGTQRLPRVVGLKQALSLILSADPISANDAQKIGLLDEIVTPDDLMDRAEQRALALAMDPSLMKRAMDLSSQMKDDALDRTAEIRVTPWCLKDLDKDQANRLFAMTERSVRIKTRGNYPAQMKAIEVIRTGINQGFKQGLEAESRAFGELAHSEVAANLISLFFATDFARQSASLLSAKFSDGRTKNIGIVGGGTMGSSIAALSAVHGLNVILKVNSGKEDDAAKSLRSCLMRARHVSDADNFEQTPNVRIIADAPQELNLQLVLETVTEDAGVKMAVLKDIEEMVEPDCIIATNTSSLPLAELSQALKKRDRFVGIHFFNPVDKMSLAEIISLPGTSKTAVARAADYVARLGKIPIMVKDGPGFLINRLLTCYLFEAARIAEEGIALNWIDEAAIDFGMPVGPLEVLDEIGMDVSLRIADSLHRAFGERMTPPSILRQVSVLGLSGKMTGTGLYLWDASGRRKELNPQLLEIRTLVSSPEKASQARRKQLAQRLIFPMIDEAARCLEERIVMKPRDIDMAIIHGIGFPPFRGGILKYADQIGLKVVDRQLQEIYSQSSAGARQVSKLIQRYILEGRNFYSRSGKDEE